MTTPTSGRLRRYWDKHSRSYDRQMGFWDRRLFRDSRAWVCGQATGETLEVAIGTGMNLPFYPQQVRLTGIDFSSAMLAQARQRADELGKRVNLQEADALRLPFPDGSFDPVVVTFSLCAISDLAGAVSEMRRVLRPGGRLLLADHIAGKGRSVRAVQRLIEVASVPIGGEYFRRRPLLAVEAAGFEIEQQQRFGPGGVVERLSALRA